MFTVFRLVAPANVAQNKVDLLPRLDYNAQWDLGDAAVIQRAFAENALVPGGVLTSESAGVRRLTVPLVLASSASYGLADLERQIRRAIRSGGGVEFQGYGASTLMRIDVAGGDLVYTGFNPRVAAVGRRPAQLRLDVQPFAYPASGMILLASTASMALPGYVSLATVMGDVPGYVRVVVSPTLGATVFAPGVWNMDMIGWAIGNGRSLVRTADLLSPTAMSLGGPTYTASYDKFSPDYGGFGSQANMRFFPQAASGWTMLNTFLDNYDPTSELTPNSAGRRRMFAWARLGPSQAMPWRLALDCAPYVGAAMASAAPVATLAPAVASGAPGAWGAQPSSAYTLIDLGEITIPPFGASAYQGLDSGVINFHYRLWAAPATTNVGVGTPIIDIGLIYGQHLDTSAGILQRGLTTPTHSVAGAATTAMQTGRLYLDGRPDRRHVLITSGGASPGLLNRNEIVGDVLQHYRGDIPIITQKAISPALYAFAGARSAASGATAPLVHAGPMYAGVTVEYSPQFVFLPFPEVI